MVDKVLAQTTEPIWLSLASKGNLTHTSYGALSWENETKLLIHHPRSARHHSAERQNQAAPKHFFYNEKPKCHYQVQTA